MKCLITSLGFVLGIFYATSSFSDQRESRDAAWDAVQQGVYIQTGAKGFVDSLSRYGEVQATRYTTKLGLTKAISVPLACYKIYKQQEIVVPIKNKRLHLRPDSVLIEIPL